MTDRIRVLFALGSLGGGGAERQVLNYLRHLDRARFAPLLYLHYRRGELLSQVPPDVPVVAFWDRHAMPRWSLPGTIYRRQVRDLAAVLAEQQIHALCAVTFLLTLVAAAAVRRRPVPWLAVEMADPRLDFAHQTTRFRRIKRRLVAAAYRQASRAVAVSAGVRDGLIDYYGVPSQQIRVLPNFIDLEEVDRLAGQDPPVWRGDGGFHIVCVGRLDEQKGHRFLLQAVDDLVHQRGRQNLRLHLLGQGPLQQELEHFVATRQLQPYVEFAGFVPNPLPSLRAADLFCLPSIYEGLPLALLEALACGTPVVATDCPSGPREILQGGQFGRLVRPQDEQALADAIAEVAQAVEHWRGVAAKGRQHVAQHYSHLSGPQHLAQLLTDICAAPQT